MLEPAVSLTAFKLPDCMLTMQLQLKHNDGLRFDYVSSYIFGVLRFRKEIIQVGVHQVKIKSNQDDEVVDAGAPTTAPFTSPTSGRGHCDEVGPDARP